MKEMAVVEEYSPWAIITIPAIMIIISAANLAAVNRVCTLEATFTLTALITVRVTTK